MGASQYWYFTPWQPDPEKALQALRKKVFEAGEFEFYGDEKPRSIEDAIEESETEGTHSILDITHVAEEDELGAAAPAPEELLEELFGTTQPTHEQVDDSEGAIADVLERWKAYYFAVYKDGKPHEWYFAGASGD